MRSLCFVVESGTDVRLVEGLAERFDLVVLARRIEDGVEISQPPAKFVLTLVGPSSRIRFAMFVWKYLRHQGREIDCVLVQGYATAAIAANLAGRLNGTPTVMLVCSPVEAYYRCRKAGISQAKPFRRRELCVLQALGRMNALVGRRYIVLSEYLAGVVHKHGSQLEIAVVPIYGVDTKVFTPPLESKTAIKARLGLPTTGALIFFSSRIAPEKDSETLLVAIRQLLNDGRDLWLLHRSGGYKDFLKDAERFGIANRVIATDAVHPLRQLPLNYQACDLCVQASREEGLGFSPLEALACEVPVVVAAVGGLKETVLDGETGWTYPVGDAAVLARSIESVLDDPLEAAMRSRAGRAMICIRYEQRIVFDELERVMLNTERSGMSRELAGCP